MNEKEYKKKTKKASIELTKKTNKMLFIILLIICFFAAINQYAKDKPESKIATIFNHKTTASSDPNSDIYNP